MCPPDSKIKYSVFYVCLCSRIIILCVILLVFYAVVRQISMLFIDNKDSVFCMQISVMLVGECVQIWGTVAALRVPCEGYVQL